MMLRAIFLIALCTFYGAESSTLASVTDDELLRYTQTEQYVVVLFTTRDCELCDKYEYEVSNLRDDLVDILNAWVVKAVDSQMLRLHSPSHEPELVFFRHGIPLLYTGRLNDEEILETFLQNKEPIVKELTDDNFEHLTQASSGATTGDWFVMFYSTDCVDCQRMIARLEAVGAKLKQRLNVARVNMYEKGAFTSRRFNVHGAPVFILFRQGKMYRYGIPKYDVNAFVSFAKDGWKNAKAEPVPVPQSPFDDFTQICANFLRDNPWVMKLGSIIIGVFVIVSVVAKLRRKAETATLKKE